MLGRLAALRRPAFVKELGREHRDQESSPIRDGVAKKRAEVGGRIGAAVEGDPSGQYCSANQTQRVMLKKGFPGASAHEQFDDKKWRKGCFRASGPAP